MTLQILLLMIGLGLVLYFTGWLSRVNIPALQGWVYRTAGAALVFGVAFLLTRNLGAAAVSLLIFSIIMKNTRTFETSPPPQRAGMSVEEAYGVFGLKPGASREDIQAAYWRIMKQNHPDQGGSTYIAAKVNEARTILLKAAKA